MTDAQHLQNIADAKLNGFLADSGLTSLDLIEAEEKILAHVQESGELPREVELDSFEIVRIDEALNEFEIKALKIMIEDDASFDLSKKDFIANYSLLASELMLKNTNTRGNEIKSFIDSLPAILEDMEETFPCVA